MKALMVASFGGHLVQLERIAEHLELDEVIWVTTRAKAMSQPHQVLTDFNKANAWRAWRCGRQAWRILSETRCDVAISTGAAPGLLLLALARLRGCRTIWIDSIANPSRLSLSGRLASRLCHVTLAQWPEVAEKYPRVRYLGGVL